MSPASPPVLTFTFSHSLSHFAIPVKEHLASHPEFEAIATSAMVFDSQNRLLVLQRAGHDSSPNLWEVPGGGCDMDDETVLYGAAREAWEETGLKVRTVRHQVGDGHVFTTRKRGLKVCKFTFEVEVESSDAVKIDPNEHQDYLWMTEEECRGYKVEREGAVVEIKFTSPAQEATILEGFRLHKEAKFS